MNAGMASGATVSTAQKRRPGKCVRSTNHAAAVPTTADTSVALTVMDSVLMSSSPTSGLKINSTASSQPNVAARYTVKASGISTSNAHNPARHEQTPRRAFAAAGLG